MFNKILYILYDTSINKIEIIYNCYFGHYKIETLFKMDLNDQ